MRAVAHVPQRRYGKDNVGGVVACKSCNVIASRRRSDPGLIFYLAQIFDDFADGAGRLIYANHSALKQPRILPVAVRDRAAVRIPVARRGGSVFQVVHERSPERDEHDIGLLQEFPRAGCRVVQFFDALFARRARKRAVRIPAVPKPFASRVLKDIVFSENFPIGNRLDLALQGNRIVNGAERICKNIELARGKLCRYVVCKARPEKRDAARVVNFESCFGRIYFGEKFHAVNIGKGGYLENERCLAL